MAYQALNFNGMNGMNSGMVPSGNMYDANGNPINQVNNMWANNQMQAVPLQGTQFSGANAAITAPSSQGMFGGLFDNMLGSTAADGTKSAGWGNLALGVGQGLANAYMGMQQYGLAKDTYEQNKKQFEMNYANQTKLTNSRLQDRQAARVASNPGAYQSVGDYMKQNGV